ncbi:MAG TPA: pilus assembly protein TadG-related protein [Rhizomicrobium sp.]|jgi:Flp pilus assembly protein TadG|nr:pilus assembly protein TadG-related protein [Rhizomicrobium sp.]
MQHETRRQELLTFLLGYWRDRSGNYLMITALSAPVLVGLIGLGTEDGIWLYTHQSAQSAADAAAFSAAQNYSMNGAGASGTNANLITEAKAIAAGYGFVNGQNSTTVTLNRPPLAADFPKYVSYQNAVEVTITQVQPRLFSKLWNKNSVTIKARAVAVGNSAKGCVLALNKVVPKAADSSGGGNIHIDNCDLYDDSTDAGDALNGGGSSMVYARFVGVVGGVNNTGTFQTQYGLATGFPNVPDPYADVTEPTTASCSGTYNSHHTDTISSGCWKTMHFNSGDTVTFNPGLYYVYGGAFQVDGGANLLCNCTRGGDGVTIVLTGDSSRGYATATVNGGGTIALQAPGKNSTMTTKGIVFFGSRNAPVGTAYKFNGGSAQNYIGAVYASKGAVTWTGGQATSVGCTQVIGDTVNFGGGGSNLSLHCDDDGTRPIGLNTMLAG